MSNTARTSKVSIESPSDPTAAAALEPYLEADERLIWAGRPRRSSSPSVTRCYGLTDRRLLILPLRKPEARLFLPFAALSPVVTVQQQSWSQGASSSGHQAHVEWYLELGPGARNRLEQLVTDWVDIHVTAGRRVAAVMGGSDWPGSYLREIGFMGVPRDVARAVIACSAQASVWTDGPLPEPPTPQPTFVRAGGTVATALKASQRVEAHCKRLAQQRAVAQVLSAAMWVLVMFGVTLLVALPEGFGLLAVIFVIVVTAVTAGLAALSVRERRRAGRAWFYRLQELPAALSALQPHLHPEAACLLELDARGPEHGRVWRIRRFDLRGESFSHTEGYLKTDHCHRWLRLRVPLACGSPLMLECLTRAKVFSSLSKADFEVHETHLRGTLELNPDVWSPSALPGQFVVGPLRVEQGVRDGRPVLAFSGELAPDKPFEPVLPALLQHLRAACASPRPAA